MAHLTDETDRSQTLTYRKHRIHAPWVWVTVLGGSVAAHLLLLGMALPLVKHLPRDDPPNPASVPIDLVELSAADYASPAPPVKATQPTTTAAKPAPRSSGVARTDSGSSGAIPQPSAIARDISITPPAAPRIVTTPKLPRQAVFAPHRSGSSARPDSQSAWQHNPLASPSPGSSPITQAIVPSPSPSVPAPLPSSIPSPASPSDRAALPLPSPTTTPLPSPPSPTITTTPSPSIATVPINVPVPEVAERMTVPSATPTRPTRIEVSREAVPIRLTAHLTVSAPPPGTEPKPDAIAHPKQPVQTFSVDPTTSPCSVTPAVVPYLGITVELQAKTDETGQISHPIVQESSHSLAYDELAQCMVQHWGFEPAVAQGRPTSDLIIIRITINQS